MQELDINGSILELDNSDIHRPKFSLDIKQLLLDISKSSSSYGCYPHSYAEMISLFFGHDYYDDDDYDSDVYGCDCWNGWEDDYDDEYYPSSKSSISFNKRKEKERSKSSPARVGSSSKKSSKKKYKSIYEEDFDDYISDSITIKFYKDLSMSDDYLEFDNLYDFDEYCSTEGIHISEKEVQLLMSRSVNYCTLDPKLRNEKGELWVKSDSSYGSLRWECIDSDDELLVQSSTGKSKIY